MLEPRCANVKRRRHHPDPKPRAEIERWWTDVLAGEAAARHPVHGDDVKVKLTDGRLELWGEVPSKRDHDQLVHEARARIGSGLHEFDASRLRVRSNGEKSGLLAQTLLAAYARRDTAELALKFLLEHSHSKPLRAQIIDKLSSLTDALPRELIDGAKKHVDGGQTLVAVDVDETEAFRVRALLEEDTPSTWTVAAPPRLIHTGRR